MRLNTYISEDSYTKMDIPSYFWVVFDIQETLDSLIKGKETVRYACERRPGYATYYCLTSNKMR